MKPQENKQSAAPRKQVAENAKKRVDSSLVRLTPEQSRQVGGGDRPRGGNY